MGINLNIAKDNSWLQAETNDPLDKYIDCVGGFLGEALSFISEGYGSEICPAIVFELWLDSGRLITYDSPVGNRLRERKERRYSQLISVSLLAELDSVHSKYERNYEKIEAETELLIEFVWGALIEQFRSEKIVSLLKDRFVKKPDFYAMPYDEYDRAFNVETGDVVHVPPRNRGA